MSSYPVDHAIWPILHGSNYMENMIWVESFWVYLHDHNISAIESVMEHMIYSISHHATYAMVRML